MLTIKNQVRDRAIEGLIFLIVLAVLSGCTPPGPKSFAKGRELYERGQYPEALAQFRSAVTELATNAVAWHYLGLAAQHAQQPAEAERAYLRALALDRDLVEARFNLGCLFLGQNRAEEAKAQFTTYILRRGNSLEGCLKLGSAQLRCREPFPAEKSFGEALRLSPNDPEALNGVGLARLQRGRPAEAAQFFASAVRSRSDYAPALLNLAVVRHQHLGDKPAALQAYRDYLQLNPPPRTAAAVSAVIAQLQQDLAGVRAPVSNQVAAAQAGKPPSSTAVALVQTSPPPAKPLSTVSNISKPLVPKPEHVADTMRAPATGLSRTVVAPTSSPPATRVETVRLPAEPVIKAAQDVSSPPAQAVAPNPEELIENAGSTSANPRKRGFFQSINPLNLIKGENKAKPKTSPMVQPQVAKEKSIPATQAPPASPQVSAKPEARYHYRNPVLAPSQNRATAERAFAQGVQDQAAHRLPEAIQAYRKATQLDPSYFEAHYNLGLSQASLGNLTAALAAYEDALAAQPQSLDARYNFALTLRKADFIRDAVNEFNKVVQSYPNETRAHLALGNIYSQLLGQPAKARAHYLKVLEVEPRHPQASAIRYWLAANP